MIYAHVLADAIVTFLGTLHLGIDVTIARRRIVTATLDGITGKQVSVIPYGPSLALEAVGEHQNDLDIRIVVQCKLDNDPDGALADAAAVLSENIAAALVGHSLLDVECQSAKLTPAYDPTKLATLDMFDAMIHTIWRTFEDGTVS
jgi:hypothetical protein